VKSYQSEAWDLCFTVKTKSPKTEYDHKECPISYESQSLCRDKVIRLKAFLSDSSQGNFHVFEESSSVDEILMLLCLFSGTYVLLMLDAKEDITLNTIYIMVQRSNAFGFERSSELESVQGIVDVREVMNRVIGSHTSYGVSLHLHNRVCFSYLCLL
jgi:hypothetical protein